MKTMSRLALLTACLFLAAAPRAQAQSQLGIGGHAGYDLTFENWFAGAQARIGAGSLPIVFQPGVEFGLSDPGYTWLEGNVLYFIGSNYTSTFTPYFGAGLSVEFQGGDTDASTLGANLIGGVQFGYGPGLAPFVQVRYTIDLESAGSGEAATTDPLGVSVGAIFRFGQ